jgi:hypothetical protein
LPLSKNDAVLSSACHFAAGAASKREISGTTRFYRFTAHVPKRFTRLRNDDQQLAEWTVAFSTRSMALRLATVADIATANRPKPSGSASVLASALKN